MICPTEDDVVYYTTGFDIVVLYDVQEGNPGFGGLGEEEQEGFYLVKGFAVARGAEMFEPMCRLLTHVSGDPLGELRRLIP
jgi:hypothetical protein